MFVTFLLAALGFTLFASSMAAFVILTVRYLAQAFATRDPQEYLRIWFMWGLTATLLLVLLFGGAVFLAIAQTFAYHWAVILIGVLLTIEISLRLWRIHFGHNSAGVGW